MLAAKYSLGLNRPQFIDTTNLLQDLNAKTTALREEAARKGLTLLTTLPATVGAALKKENPRIAYVQLGGKQLSVFGKRLQADWNASTFLLSYKDTTQTADSIYAAVKATDRFDLCVIGVHDYANKPMNNFGISTTAKYLYSLLNGDSTLTLTFGNVLAIKKLL